jgi:hypothetical protein
MQTTEEVAAAALRGEPVERAVCSSLTISDASDGLYSN